MSPLSLVVSDIDGTLARSDKSVSAANMAAVRRLGEAGVMVSLISARPPSGMLWIARDLGLEGPFGAFNGGTLFGGDGSIVAAERLDPAIARAAARLIDRPDVTPWLFCDGKWYARTLVGSHVPREVKSAGLDPIICDGFDHLLDRVDKLVAVSDDHDALGALEISVAAALGGGATVARSQPYYLDITAPRANKGDGLSAIAAAFGVPLAAVAVLGDQNNDLPMFARAGIAVAMGQAPANVRAAATHVARSNDDDGVADAIDRLLLPLIGSRKDS